MKIRVEIPEPCSENWNEMTPTERGAFCHKCNKDVFDFSFMTDSEIIQTLSNNKNTCGRFREDQLNTPMSNEQPKSGWNIAKYAFALPALLVASNGYSFTKNTNITNNNIEQINILNGDSNIVISGKILDSIGNPIAYAIIKLDSTVNVKADSLGRFELTTLVKNGTESVFSIVVSHAYFEETQIKVNTASSIVYDIVLENRTVEIIKIKRDYTCIAGGISFHTYPIQTIKPTFKTRIKGFFKRLFSRKRE